MAGQPLSPNIADTAPSFICEPTVKRGSCACCAITPSNFFIYSRARRITKGSNTQLPSSLNTRTRAIDSAIAPISERALPSSPFVTAPIGKTSSKPAS